MVCKSSDRKRILDALSVTGIVWRDAWFVHVAAGKRLGPFETFTEAESALRAERGTEGADVRRSDAR